jgi:hypothetical protein
MSVGAERLIGLARALVSDAPATREDGCGTVTDWISSFSTYEARLVAMLLVTLAGTETNVSCRESELHALNELADTGALSSDVIEPVRLLDKSALSVSELEYVNYLTEETLGDS